MHLTYGTMCFLPQSTNCLSVLQQATIRILLVTQNTSYSGIVTRKDTIATEECADCPVVLPKQRKGPG
jgi:hypothetical protein